MALDIEPAFLPCSPPASCFMNIYESLAHGLKYLTVFNLVLICKQEEQKHD